MGAVNANAPEEKRLGRQRGRPRRIHREGTRAAPAAWGIFRGLTTDTMIIQAYMDCKSFFSFNWGLPCAAEATPWNSRSGPVGCSAYLGFESPAQGGASTEIELSDAEKGGEK